MRRKFNYTGRQRLIYLGKDEKHFIPIIKKTKNKETSISIEFFKDKLENWNECNVFLEWRLSSIFRMKALNKVKDLQSTEEVKDLGNIDPTLIVLAVKFVDDNGKLLAKADNIKPQIQDASQGPAPEKLKNSFFIWAHAPLGGSIYEMEVKEHSKPKVILNNSEDELSLKSKINQKSIYKSLLFPSLIRELLLIYLTNTDLQNCTYREKILKMFNKQIPYSFDIENIGYDYGEITDWINRIVGNFCENNNLKEAIRRDTINE
jgi:hypothetical protein